MKSAMTVKDLIEALLDLPLDAEVWIADGTGTLCHGVELDLRFDGDPTCAGGRQWVWVQ